MGVPTKLNQGSRPEGCAPLHALPHDDQSFKVQPVYYAVTIKGTGKCNYYTQDELYHRLELMNTRRRPCIIEAHRYELDSNNRLHVHALVKCSNGFFLPQRKGWHNYSTALATVDDVKRWIDYINKYAYNLESQDQIFNLNYLYNHNLFI